MPNNSYSHLDIITNTIEKAKALGASLAGIANVTALQMKQDETNEVVIEEAKYGNAPRTVIKHCRACELVCPVAG